MRSDVGKRDGSRELTDGMSRVTRGPPLQWLRLSGR